MNSYKDLEIYQLSHKLAIKVHTMTLHDLPKFEMYEKGAQIRRSSKSVASNIVEGFGCRFYQADYRKFLIYAHSSCDETKEHLELLFEAKSFKNKDLYDFFMKEYDKLSKKINKFLQAFKRAA